MKLTCFFVQRTCRYPGECAPELFNAVDEVCIGEDPDYMSIIEEGLAQMFADKEIQFWRKIVVVIDDDHFKKAFNPDVPVIAGSIFPGHHQAQSEDSDE